MDLQDWFTDSIESPPGPNDKPCELTVTLKALHSSLKPGGRVFFRSAGLAPWYLELYKRLGFEVECVHQREIGSKLPIDRVQMYVWPSSFFLPPSALLPPVPPLPPPFHPSFSFH
jgi:betaine lipid synthase